MLALAIPAQAVLGGITVLTDLNPWVVSLHLLVSLAIVSLAVVFLHRLDHPPTAPAHGFVPTLGWTTYGAAWLVLYAGTVVTGSGPHAGDASAPRNELDPLQVSQLHADLVFLLIGLTVGMWFLARATGGDTRPALALLAVEASQAVVGYIQYFAGLPVGVVLLHMLGASLVMATATWVLVVARQPVPGQAKVDHPALGILSTGVITSPLPLFGGSGLSVCSGDNHMPFPLCRCRERATTGGSRSGYEGQRHDASS